MPKEHRNCLEISTAIEEVRCKAMAKDMGRASRCVADAIEQLPNGTPGLRWAEWLPPWRKEQRPLSSGRTKRTAAALVLLNSFECSLAKKDNTLFAALADNAHSQCCRIYGIAFQAERFTNAHPARIEQLHKCCKTPAPRRRTINPLDRLSNLRLLQHRRQWLIELWQAHRTGGVAVAPTALLAEVKERSQCAEFRYDRSLGISTLVQMRYKPANVLRC